MYPPVDPIIFQVGPIALRWYGVLMILGITAATTVAARYVERKGYPGDSVWDMLLFVLIPGLIGARLYYVFIQSPRTEGGLQYYLSNPAAIFQIWNGGIHIFGAFLFGGAALFLYARWRNLPLPIYLDGVGLGLPLGQSIGRLANFINQELYGPPTTLPWGLRIDPEHRIGPFRDLNLFPETVRFHPLFLYESVWNIVGFGVLFWISRHYEDRLLPGDLFLMYLIWYPAGRFMLEFIRTDSWFFAGTPINTVHILSFCSIIGAAALLIIRHSRRRTTAAA